MDLVGHLLASTQQTSEGCWLWTGGVDRCGYGKWNYPRYHLGMSDLIHRFAYELLVGPIPSGLQIDHTCHNAAAAAGRCAGGATCLHRRCINPRHLVPATNWENGSRGLSFAAVNARKTHCANNHPFSPENTYVKGQKGRSCKRCTADAQRRYQERKRAAAS